MGLNSEAECREFLNTHDSSTIAEQLRHDKAACLNSRLPSLLALYLPSSKTELANLIAIKLFPETAEYGKSIRMTQYNGLVTIIKSHLKEMKTTSKHENLPVLESNLKRVPSKDEIETALDVLDFCFKSTELNVHLHTSFEDLVHVLQQRLPRVVQSPTPPQISSQNPLLYGSRRRTCYICQFLLLTPHPQYSSLCKPCGDYNLASSAISLPANLKLANRTALVTGGRLNLGYHTALRLLRCGAKVVVTSRYPQDAETRYLKEDDSDLWKSRLRIVGADFRSANDVFHLVAVAKQCLREWNKDGIEILDILINNAAQTLTDSISKEHKAVNKEFQLKLDGSKSKNTLILDDNSYTARVRGGVNHSKTLNATPTLFLEGDVKETYNSQSASSSLETNHVFGDEIAGIVEKVSSSWVQSIQQIPYEDVISAHSVNTFVPLILLRELLPIMGSTTKPTSTSTTSTISVPSAYIINVSSREGIFEASTTSASKHGKHVHTNLTKAALNMLTETEAGPAWKQRRVAINTVDPGFMSAAPEVEKMWKDKAGKDWRCPIGWEDGAGRVLWPIAMSESGKGAIWGRFLKHFGSVEIDLSVGR